MHLNRYTGEPEGDPDEYDEFGDKKISFFGLIVAIIVVFMLICVFVVYG